MTMVSGISSSKFPLGRLLMSRAVAETSGHDLAFASFVYQSLKRHSQGDWGDLDAEDKAMNDTAYLVKWDPNEGGDRVFSAYEAKGLPKIWVITEADRSATTVIFPEDY